MSEQTVSLLAKELSISLEQANAIWLKTRQAMLTTILNGGSVDLGFAYLSPAKKAARRRHDFGAKSTIVTPEQPTIKILVPPHVKDVLAGKAALCPYIWMTRSRIKGLSVAEQEELRRQGNDYYRLKGVTG